MAGIMNKALSPNVVKTGLDMVTFPTFERAPAPQIATALDPMLFNQDRAENSAVIGEVFGGVTAWTATAEEAALPQEAGRIKDQQTFSVVDYKKSVPVTREFMRDHKFSAVNRQVRDAANKGLIARDKGAMDVYRLGFTTKLTNDAVALFSASHITGSGDTVSNLGTATLADASFNTGLVALAEQKDQAGEIVGHEAAVLLVPSALFKQACIITESQLRPGTTNNDMNVYSTKYNVVVKQSPYLGAAAGGSDSAWFLIGMNHAIYRWVREGFNTDYVGPEFSPNDIAYYKMRFAEVCGATSYEGVWASNGTV